MSKVSTARKMGIVTRVAAQQVRRTRTFSAVTTAGRATWRNLTHVLGQLWLEVTGFVFLALAAIGFIAMLREYSKYHAGQATSSRVVLALCFAGVFGWFGITSFWQVRRRQRK